MTAASYAHELYGFMMAALLLAGPALLIAGVLGLGLGILQAVTQIQDQTLPAVLKIVVISIGLFVLGGRMAIPLHDRTLEVFASFPTMVR